MGRGVKTVRRGELYWADPGPVVGHEQGGHRPVLVISHDMFNSASGTAIVLAVTSRPPLRRAGLSVRLASGDLPRPSWVKTWQVRTTSLLRLGRFIGRVDEKEVDAAADALHEVVAHG